VQFCITKALSGTLGFYESKDVISTALRRGENSYLHERTESLKRRHEHLLKNVVSVDRETASLRQLAERLYTVFKDAAELWSRAGTDMSSWGVREYLMRLSSVPGWDHSSLESIALAQTDAADIEDADLFEPLLRARDVTKKITKTAVFFLQKHNEDMLKGLHCLSTFKFVGAKDSDLVYPYPSISR